MRVLITPDSGFDIYTERLKYFLRINKVDVCGVKADFFLILLKFFSFKPNIIHFHWQSPFIIGRNLFIVIIKSIIFLIEVLFLRLVGVKIVWTVHNLVNHEKQYWQIEKFISRIFYFICNRVVVHLCSQKDVLMSFYFVNDNKIYIVREGNFIDISSKYLEFSSRELIRKDNSEKIIYLFFGQLRKYKGLEFMLESFKRVSRDDIDLYIVGNPFSCEYLRKIEKLSYGDKRINLIPKYVKDDVLYNYISSADCVILPYNEIFNSTALIMAMSFSKPVIVTKNFYFEEILGKDYPLMVEFGDVNKLVKLIESLNIEELKNIGKFCFERIKGINWDFEIKKLIKIYEDII